MEKITDIVNKYIEPTLTGETSLTSLDIVAVFVITLLLGLYIFMIYKHHAKSEFYSKDFNITLPALTVITACIMIAMQANLLVSLGMIGSLSIVRFRTAVKSPIDLLYLFWAIAVGIISGVGLYSLAVLLCLAVTLILYELGYAYEINTSSLLFINISRQEDIKQVEKIIKKSSKKNELASMTAKDGEFQYVYELTSSDFNALANELTSIKSVKSVNIISHTGERRTQRKK